MAWNILNLIAAANWFALFLAALGGNVGWWVNPTEGSGWFVWLAAVILLQAILTIHYARPARGA